MCLLDIKDKNGFFGLGQYRDNMNICYGTTGVLDVPIEVCTPGKKTQNEPIYSNKPESVRRLEDSPVN